MGFNQEYYNKVNKFNIRLVWIFTVILIAQAYIFNGATRGFLVIRITGIPAIVCSLLYVSKRVSSKVVAMVIPIAYVIIFTLLAFIDKGYSPIMLGYFAVACMSALYFDSKIVLMLLGIIDFVYLFCLFVLKTPLLGEVLLEDAAVQFVILNCGIMLLYFLTKWGSEYLQDSINNQHKSEKLVDNLENNIKIIEDSSKVLNQSIDNSRSYISALYEISEATVQGMNEMSKGTEEEARAIAEISMMMNNASEKLNDIQKQSENNEKISDDVNEITKRNKEDIQNMVENMNTIDIAVDKSFNTVDDLGRNMTNIRSFLTVIEDIASQTKMLSLNASIEAARAGDAGKGFEVVASQIRELSERSNEMVGEISEIINITEEKANNAVEDVKNGTLAVNTGQEALKTINQSMEELFGAFAKMKENIQREYESINEMTELFTGIGTNVESTASIMQEYAATTEEVNATMEEQNTQVSLVADVINNIKENSNKLVELTSHQ